VKDKKKSENIYEYIQTKQVFLKQPYYLMLRQFQFSEMTKFNAQPASEWKIIYCAAITIVTTREFYVVVIVTVVVAVR